MKETQQNLFAHMTRLIEAGIDPVSRQRDIWTRYGERSAILVVDSSGFSRVSQSHGIVHFLSRLMQLRELCNEHARACNCQRLHFEADNAFAAFATAREAIDAALALQRAVHDSRLMLTEEERFRVSMGVGYGDLLYSETLEGYFGDEMNYASKLGEDIARGDEVLVTQAAWEAAGSPSTPGFARQETTISGISLTYYRHRFIPCEAAD